MKTKRYTRVFLWMASLLCIASLALPCFYIRWSDQWLQARGRPRADAFEGLSAEGQENALAYALYRNRFLAGKAIETTADLASTQQELQTATETLYSAGVLPEGAVQRVRNILNRSDAYASRKTENGFASATYLVVEEEGNKSCSVQATWQEKTGTVVSYSVTADATTVSLDEYLLAYRSYLGLETLQDWTEVAAAASGEVSSQSGTGQLYLFYRWEGDTLRLGVVSQDISVAASRS